MEATGLMLFLANGDTDFTLASTHRPRWSRRRLECVVIGARTMAMSVATVQTGGEEPFIKLGRRFKAVDGFPPNTR